MTRLIVRQAEFDGAVSLAMSRYGWPRERAVAAAEHLYVPAVERRPGSGGASTPAVPVASPDAGTAGFHPSP